MLCHRAEWDHLLPALAVRLGGRWLLGGCRDAPQLLPLPNSAGAAPGVWPTAGLVGIQNKSVIW